MARRCDPKALDLARARASLAADGASNRTARRRKGTPPHLTGVDPAILLAASDETRRSTVLARATAAAHADEIARAIDTASRADVLGALGAEARAFGLSRRRLACVPSDARPFVDRLAETKARADELLKAHLNGAPLEAGLGACLAAALAEETP